jgi:adenylate kinase
MEAVHGAAEKKILKKGSHGLKLFISGAPASGKGTQCEVIKERYGVVHLSTGDILRAAVDEGTAVGVEAKACMDSGRLVPDSLIISIVKERRAQVDCVEKGWLLDGFPRTREQADSLAADGVTADAFIHLDVPDSVVVARISGRVTDPVTGAIYHDTFDPPPEGEVGDRCVRRDDDTEEKVMVRPPPTFPLFLLFSFPLSLALLPLSLYNVFSSSPFLMSYCCFFRPSTKSTSSGTPAAWARARTAPKPSRPSRSTVRGSTQASRRLAAQGMCRCREGGCTERGGEEEEEEGKEWCREEEGEWRRL